MSKPDPNRVLLFDTTLRDGEQSPGISLNKKEKLEIAHQLARLGVDIIEAGFPIASEGDFDAVQGIAQSVHGPIIAGLARANAADIDRCWDAVKDSERPRIHTFCSTSDIHIQHQMQNTRDDVRGLVRASVSQAKALCDDVEFSPMDATRAEPEFNAEIIQIAIDEGATTVNVPDTVGYDTPDEYGEFLTRMYELTPDLERVILSVHCHDDLGLAVANSLAGVQAGARQIECAVNGIGERAGNASIEELIMLFETRKDRLGFHTGAVTTEIAKTSRLVSRLTGYPVQPNKAIVGSNAFAHESGIHQDGVLKDRTTFEIMSAESVGLDSNSLVLGKHSGRHALRSALEELGYKIDGAALNKAFKAFKDLADKKKDVSAMDLEAIVTDELRSNAANYRLVSYKVSAETGQAPSAEVVVTTPEGEDVTGSDQSGDGTIECMYRAIQAATQVHARLKEYRVDATTGGGDSLGEVSVVVELGPADGPVMQKLPGVIAGERVTGAGQGVSSDVVQASAIAYIRAISNAVTRAKVEVGVAAGTATP